VTSLWKSLEKAGRIRSAELLRKLLVRGSPAGELPEHPRRILVIRPDTRLGNLVLLEPLLRSLKQRFPEASLDVLASHVFQELLESQGYRMIGVDKKGQIARPWEFAELAEKLAAVRYDTVIDASHPHAFSLSGAVTAALTGSPCRIGTGVGRSGGWFSHAVPVPPGNVHESAALHGLGTLWEGWPAWSRPSLSVSSPGAARNCVGLHVGASGRKAFPYEYLDALAGLLCRGRAVVEVYWGGEGERLIAERLRRAHPVRMMPAMTVTELLTVMVGLRGLVTADNGPMHVASALGVPVVALFRVDNASRFAPLSEGSGVVLDPEAAHPGEAVRLLQEAAGVDQTPGFFSSRSSRISLTVTSVEASLRRSSFSRSAALRTLTSS
jgi:heptosyltransferase III